MKEKLQKRLESWETQKPLISKTWKKNHKKRLEGCEPQKTMISKNRKENNKETFTDNLD